MSKNRHIAASTFLERYVGIFNNDFVYIAELYRNNSKCQLMCNDGNFKDAFGIHDILKLKYMGKDMKLRTEQIYDVRTSHYPKAIAFNFKGSITIDCEKKYIEQILHIAMNDHDETIYIIDEKLVIIEKID